MKSLLRLLILFQLGSCTFKHLHEKTFTSGDITATWYEISDITNVHDFVDLQRWGWTRTIVKTNTGDIQNILIDLDTVVIQVGRRAAIDELMAKTLGCYIRIDSSDK